MSKFLEAKLSVSDDNSKIVTLSKWFTNRMKYVDGNRSPQAKAYKEIVSDVESVFPKKLSEDDIWTASTDNMDAGTFEKVASGQVKRLDNVKQIGGNIVGLSDNKSVSVKVLSGLDPYVPNVRGAEPEPYAVLVINDEVVTMFFLNPDKFTGNPDHDDDAPESN